jgi:hypothetical protein
VLGGAVGGLIGAIPIPGMSALGGALVTGALGVYSEDVIENTFAGESMSFSEYLYDAGLGALGGEFGTMYDKQAFNVADKLWNSLSRTKQKTLLRSIGDIDNNVINIVRREMKNGVTPNLYHQLFEKYGVNTFYAGLMSGFNTEIIDQLNMWITMVIG